MNAVPVTTITKEGEVVPFQPKVLKLVTVPLIKLRPGMTVYVQILDKMEQAAPLKAKPGQKTDDEKKQPPTLIKVRDLTTGRPAQIIAGSILKDILNDSYPNNGYVGKGFAVELSEQKASGTGGGRRYNTYNVSEIEVPK